MGMVATKGRPFYVIVPRAPFIKVFGNRPYIRICGYGLMLKNTFCVCYQQHFEYQGGGLMDSGI